MEYTKFDFYIFVYFQPESTPGSSQHTNNENTAPQDGMVAQVPSSAASETGPVPTIQ